MVNQQARDDGWGTFIVTGMLYWMAAIVSPLWLKRLARSFNDGIKQYCEFWSRIPCYRWSYFPNTNTGYSSSGRLA